MLWHERIYQCNSCDILCESANKFREHYQSHMEPDEVSKLPNDTIQNADILWRCKQCDIILSDVKARNRHRTNIHKPKRRAISETVCDTCGQVFVDCDKWRLHLLFHQAEKNGNPYPCSLCPKSFVTRWQLNLHMKRHSKERPHVCEVCGKTFKILSILAQHRQTHNKVKSYTCQFCGKGFTSSYNFKGHLRTHTGEKPFQCDLCNAAFTHNVSLKTHKKSVHGIDVWKDQKQGACQEFDDPIQQSVADYPANIISTTKDSVT